MSQERKQGSCGEQGMRTEERLDEQEIGSVRSSASA